MQIRPGGEKLSDTKVGEFDRRALLLRLSAMQAMRRTLRPIITDAEIGSAVARRRWTRRSSCTEQKQGGEGKLFHFRGGLCIFSPVLLSGNEQMVINVWRGNLPSSRQVFPADTIFSIQGRKWNFSQRCITSCRAPPPTPVISAFLSGYPLQRGRGRNLLSIFKKEKLSVAITQRAHQGWYMLQ